MSTENSKFDFHSWELPDKEYKFYQSLPEKDKRTYEKNWLAVETQKQKLAQARARQQKARAAATKRERASRTHRLIEIGNAVEAVLKKALGDIDGVIGADDIQALTDYLQKQEDRGRYFSHAIINARSKRDPDHLAENDSYFEDNDYKGRYISI